MAKLIPGVNFINILTSALHQYYFAKKLQSQTLIREKYFVAIQIIRYTGGGTVKCHRMAPGGRGVNQSVT